MLDPSGDNHPSRVVHAIDANNVADFEAGNVGWLNVLTEGGPRIYFDSLGKHGDQTIRGIDPTDRPDDAFIDVDLIGVAGLVGLVGLALDASHLPDSEL